MGNRGRGRQTDRQWKWQYTWESERARTALHPWSVFQNIIWQRVHLSYVFLYRSKPNRLEEVCCSQTASLPGSDPSAHWLQRGREIYLGYCGLIYHQANSPLEKNRSKLLMLPQGVEILIWLDAEQRDANVIRQERELHENMEICCKLYMYHRHLNIVNCAHHECANVNALHGNNEISVKNSWCDSVEMQVQRQIQWKAPNKSRWFS